MTKEQYDFATAALRARLSILDVTTARRCEDPTQHEHLAWMLDQVEDFATDGRFEKASRWLGFVQGVLVAQGRLTLEQAKRVNMPIGAEYDGERV